jgi:uncharacterized protein (TIGR02466 family)
MITFPFNDCWIYSQTLNLNLEEIKNKIYEFERTNLSDIHVAPKIKSNIKESNFDFLKESNLFLLEKEILNSVDQCIKELLGDAHDIPNTKIIESWYHIATYGGYHGIHNHPGSPIGGIYYISTNDCTDVSGDNKFYKPYITGNIDMYGPLTQLMPDAYQVIPEDNKLVLFPGFLFHSATPYYGKSERICIAFNINF